MKHHALIQFYVDLSKAMGFHVVNVLGESASIKVTAFQWDIWLKYTRTSQADHPLEGLPKTTSTPEIIARIQGMVSDLLETLCILLCIVSNILNEVLFPEHFVRFRNDKKEFVRRSITKISHNDAESKLKTNARILIYFSKPCQKGNMKVIGVGRGHL